MRVGDNPNRQTCTFFQVNLIVNLLVTLVLGLLISTATSAAQVKLTYSYWGGPEHQVIHKALIAGFMRKNPDIVIEPMLITGNYEEKIAVLVASGESPDIMFFEDEPFPAWVRRGVFADLHDRFAKDPSINLDDYVPQSKEYFQYKGRQYALPSEGGAITWFYNKTMLQQAGLRDPRRDWNIAEWADYVKKLTIDKNGDGKIDQFGAGMPSDFRYSIPLFWSFGAKFVDVDLSTKEIAAARTNSPQFIESLEFQKDLRQQYKVSGGQYSGGTMGFMMSGPWSLIEAHQRMDGKIEWDVAHIPVGPRGQRATRHSFDTWTIASDSKHIDEAYKFVSYALSMDGLQGFSERAFPAKVSAAQKFFIKPETPQHEEVFVDIMLNYTWMQPTYVQWKDVDKIFGNYMTQVYNGKIPPAAAAERMQVEANAVLMQMWPESWQSFYRKTGKLPPEADTVFAADRALRGGF